MRAVRPACRFSEEAKYANPFGGNATGAVQPTGSLQELHQQLAREIEQKEGRSDIDDLTLHRLKKEKLLAKDKIIMLQSQLEPDKRA